MSEQKPTSGATWLTTPSFAEAMDRMFAVGCWVAGVDLDEWEADR